MRAMDMPGAKLVGEIVQAYGSKRAPVRFDDPWRYGQYSRSE